MHVRQHTDSPPFDCPLCKNSGHFEEISELTEHLAERHLPKMSKTATIEKVTVTRMTKEDKSVANSAAVAAAAASAAAAAATAAAPGGVRDENAVNREIAALLLNLHSSRGDQPATATPAAAVSGLPKAEDLSVKSVDNAMDLSKKQATVTLNTPLPASITKITKQSALNGGGSLDLSTKVTPTSSSAATTLSLPLTPNYSQLYPSLASLSGLSSNSNLAMSSNYLLQNLLLGKMQQIAAASGGDPAAVAAAAAAAGVSLASTSTTTASSSSSNGSLSFPTQPLPAQALSLPATTTTASPLKPPAAVMKSSSSSAAAAFAVQNGQSSGKSPSSTTASATTLQQLQLNESNTSANIPLLCGQIVAQLNGLLFLVHGLNQPQIELNLQSQLVAIYTRLQEVVAMVEAAKKQEEENKGIQKTLEKMKENKMKEEESIAKQLQDYQRALLQQHQEAASSQPLKETAASVDVVTLLKRQAQAGGGGLEIKDVNGTEQSMEVDSAAAAARRRRGRPPKNSNLDLSYSPPDKRARESTDDPAALIIPAAAAAALNGVSSPTMSMELPAKSQAVVSSGGGGGGGKGIRNRVFCGECAGCLKNDDCGRCRYCQDKTKFGGQNRLRQKCLHRRCLMDTHRKRSTGNAGGALGGSNNAAAAAAAVAAAVAASNAAVVAAANNAAAYSDGRSPSPSGIYSGLDLARLAEAVSQAEKIQNGDAATDSEAKPRPERRDSAATIEPMRRSTRSRQKSAESKQAAAAMAAAAAAANGNSDDDSDDQKSSGGSSTGGGGGKTQSRIDKWKAKHEAMMKMAEGKEAKEGDEADEEPEAAVVGEHIGEVKDDDEDEEEEVAVAAVADKGDKVESDEPEIPNIDGTNGVCIDLNGSNAKTSGSKAAGKPHTRHSAVQQQVNIFPPFRSQS